MKNLSRNRFFLLSLLLPIVILLSMTVMPLLTLYYGDTVKLQTVPYDPRDLFYGDYVDLDFEAENIPIDLVEESLRRKLDNYSSSGYPLNNPKVYLIVTPNHITGVHDVSSVTTNKPKSGTYIKGNLDPYVYEGKVTVSIPIEKYYLEEDTGRSLEEASRKGQLIATMKVFNGYALLRNVE